MAASRDAVAEVESLGYGAIWVPEAVGREPFANAALLLSAGSTIKVGTGIASIHARTAQTMQAGWKTISEAFPGRFLLGLGVSHQPMVEGVHGHAYDKPYSTMVSYLDAMDRGMFFAVRAERGAAARARRARSEDAQALRRARARARTRTSCPSSTPRSPVRRWAPARCSRPSRPSCSRPIRAKAREIARRHMTTYLGLPNYTNNLKRLGWTDADISDGGSDALVDAIVAWGTLEQIVDRVHAHHAAGADHVCVQVLPADPRGLPMAEWRELATALPDL